MLTPGQFVTQFIRGTRNRVSFGMFSYQIGSSCEYIM